MPIRTHNVKLAAMALFVLLGIYHGFSQEYTFTEYSQPQGIFSPQTNFFASGVVTQSVNVAQTSSGYGFTYWTVNGQIISDAAGQSPTSVTCQMTNNVTAIAWYLPVSQSTNGSGIPDYLEFFYYDSATNAATSDTDGDGFNFLQELARGYDPVIPDTTVNGGEVMRLSDSPAYVPPSNPQYYYVIESQPQGIISTVSGYVPTNTPVQTPNIPYGLTSGYGFGFWTLNGVRQAGPSGAALTQITLPMTNDETAIAWFYPPTQSSNGGLPDWYQYFWFGNLNQTTNSDPTGDGFTIANDLSRGYGPVVTNTSATGGEVMRLSDSIPYIPPSNPQYYYVIESQPQGIIPTTSGYVPTNTPVQAQNISYGLTSGYDFGFWTINGIRQAGPSGAALTQVTLPMTNDETAIADFYLPGQSSNGGLPDWYQYFWFGNTNQTTNSDPTGDGFKIADDISRGYSPVVTNITVNGGEVMRLSDSITYVPPIPPKYYYLIESQPQGIISTTDGYVLANTPVQSPEISYGLTSGYDFGFWTINGIRQAGPSGAALTQIILPMTNDETAIAKFYLPTQSSNGGLPDWYQYFWFGNLNQATNSDPTGDGFMIADDLARDYSPVVTNSTMNGGEILRLSGSTVYVPPPYMEAPYYREVIIGIVNGQIVLEWSAGGILQSAPAVTGPYTNVIGAMSPYVVVPTRSQLFFRVLFP